MSDLTGKTVLVTGAGSGIGRAIADRFAADGATVACADIDIAAAEIAAQELRSTGCTALAVEVDIANEQSVAEMVKTVVAATGRIDSVAANAGMMVEGDILSVSLDG
ncbi:SDR family NAD(P)-dependent oxidoreductase [Congregibacter sp.]|nr:SDR family NAD(P)-dependent oxidoreductase [Congregibacter sp.]MDA8962073.1 SDR family NAD(P)-dependent oxidoreductase [Congregibacter sp.]